MGGSNQIRAAGIYGTQGIPSLSNMPGARDNAVAWTDSQGNFWLFGGIGDDSTDNTGLLNDLWRYSNGEWTWMAGSNLSAQPGTYGTKGVPSPQDSPGARFEATGWSDASGNLWLFGGTGIDSTGTSADLNDLWRFSNGEWSWVSGSNVGDQAGVWGTKGEPDSANVPSSRYGAVSWTDPFGNLWLFGGSGSGSGNCTSCSPQLGDLWRYSGGEWTWMGGSNLNSQPGVYGTEGLASADNVPPPRDDAATWTDAEGDFWLFGGVGAGDLDLNDLWEYRNGEWTWMNGSDQPCQNGTYGALGTPSSVNIPGARDGAVTWTDESGNLWFFGGEDTYCIGTATYNDLWEYQP
ncbi:MAG: kelch repeat-containing protein [Acidobacteriaceae bacterium]